MGQYLVQDQYITLILHQLGHFGLMVCIPHFGLYARYDEIGIWTISFWILSVI